METKKRLREKEKKGAARQQVKLFADSDAKLGDVCVCGSFPECGEEEEQEAEWPCGEAGPW